MKYTFQGTTEVYVRGESDHYRKEISMYIGDEPREVDNESFAAQFQHLQELVEAEFEEKNQGGPSVTRVLQHTDISPAAWLWYAFVVNDMIDYFAWAKSWADESLDAVGFLYSETTFVCGMETTK